jgi:hypothetical protein
MRKKKLVEQINKKYPKNSPIELRMDQVKNFTTAQ